MGELNSKMEVIAEIQNLIGQISAIIILSMHSLESEFSGYEISGYARYPDEECGQTKIHKHVSARGIFAACSLHLVAKNSRPLTLLIGFLLMSYFYPLIILVWVSKVDT